MAQSHTKKLTLSALFLALGFILPMLTGQVPVVGKALLPMHIPVFLCALICGWKYALTIGFVLPLARSFLFSVPILYPTAIAVAFEMAAYGLVTGLLYPRLQKHGIAGVYLAMLPAMLMGRAVRLVAEVLLLGFRGNPFVWRAFLAGTIFNAVPGILLQLFLIPAVMLTLSRAKLLKRPKRAKNAQRVDVYLAKMPDDGIPLAPVLSPARLTEIEETANARVKREKHAV